MTFQNQTLNFKNLYGMRVYIIARQLEKLYQKQTKTQHHIQFLRRCKRSNVIPHGLLINNNTRIQQNEYLLNKTMTKIRNNTLSWQHKQINNINKDITTQENIIGKYMKQI